MAQVSRVGEMLRSELDRAPVCCEVAEMLISHAHRFILTSPWKTASSTCHQSLQGLNESRYDRFFQFNPHLNRVVHQHLTLAEILALPEGKLGYKVGSFVRNPYDRAYSGFIQIQRDFEVQPKLPFEHPWIADLVRDQIAQNMDRVIQAGFDFDAWIERLPDYEILDVGRNSNMVLHPAHYWTHVNGEMCADFVGKVETFETDFQRFCEFVGIPTRAIVSSNLSQEAETGGVAAGAKYVARMSRSSIDRINALFRRDFELFEYEML